MQAQKSAPTLTAVSALIDLGVFSPARTSEVIIRPAAFASASIMNSRRLEARISSVQAEAMAAKKVAQTAEFLSKSVKENLRDAKKALKKVRQLYKDGRRKLKSLRRERESAHKSFKKASQRLERLQDRAQKRIRIPARLDSAAGL
jgi:hypothetical protein